MLKYISRLFLVMAVMVLSLVGTSNIAEAYLQGAPGVPALVAPGQPVDYLTTPNWAYSPIIRKFVDPLPEPCNPLFDPNMCDAGYPVIDAAGLANPDGTSVKNIPVAVPDIVTYPGSDYYEIELVEFKEMMHSDLVNPTTLRGYRQVGFGTDTRGGCTDPVDGPTGACTAADNTLDFNASHAHYLGPVILAQKDRPVRVKFYNKLGTGPDGDLFVPVDQSIMGSGEYEVDYDPVTKEVLSAPRKGKFAQNRGELHLHGGRTPWISDGTPHQWITPAGEDANYPQGVSVENVSDMEIPAPNSGVQTYYWTNQQSARMMFYHDHAWGITRLNVYVGEAAGYAVSDPTEEALVGTQASPGVLPLDFKILVVQDKSYVDATPTTDRYGNAGVPTILTTDPTWRWGTGSITGSITEFNDSEPVRAPLTGDLWWPHVYMPAQNPFDITGIAPMGRWAYGPYFWPATANPYQPEPNPYYNPACNVGDAGQTEANTFGMTTIGDVKFCQPPEVPSTPNPSWGAEAFMDTPTVNGTAYPVMNVEPKAYRLKFLNAAHDRFFNLQMYNAATLDPNTFTPDPALPAPDVVCSDFNLVGGCATQTEVAMVSATDHTAEGFPDTWPQDGRDGGVPDYTQSGPDWIMYASEGGFLPQPVVIPQQPVDWNVDVTTFNAGNVNAGSLILGPAERAEVVVDFSQFAGQTLILYNDAPAPWPALDPHYDYFTGAPDLTDIGGTKGALPGLGPNTRTIMKIVVADTAPAAPFDLAALQAEFTANVSTFQKGQDPLIVGQGNMNPTGDPAFYEAFIHGDRTGTTLGGDYSVDYSGLSNAYNSATFPTNYPDWGVARINDKSINFVGVDGDTTYAYNAADNTTHPLDPGYDMNGGIPLQFKAIQDEQGETFDDYGRMRAGLGIENIAAGAGVVNFIIQTYSDPATEILEENGIQVWKITHNGVDTHPVHFHLYDVQVLNRVGWDGFIRLPDPTEAGWKDTVRISPLEDTIVALKPITPLLPFGVWESYRPLNPAKPLGDTTELTQIDPFTGTARSNLNRIVNLDWEYVWHCHILSHEENDMMRPQSFLFQEALPGAVTNTSVSINPAGDAVVTWTDPTPVDYVTTTNFGNPQNEIGFRIYRNSGAGSVPIADVTANATKFTDLNTTAGPTVYAVSAFNQVGEGPAGFATTVSPFGVISPNGGEVLVRGTNATIEWAPYPNAVSYIVRFSSNGGASWVTLNEQPATDPTSFNWAIPNRTLTTQGLVRITAVRATGPSVFDDSDAVFTVTSQGTVVAPNGGETLVGLTNTEIVWSPHPAATSYRILMSNNGGASWVKLTDQPATDPTTFTWSVPNGTTSDMCLIRVNSVGGGGLVKTDISDAPFTIVKAGTVLVPNLPGLSLTGGSALNIEWAAHANAASYRVLFSSDGGAHWTLLQTQDAAFAPSFNWVIPNTITTTQGRIKVTSHAAGGALISADQSDNNFSVTPL